MFNTVPSVLFENEDYKKGIHPNAKHLMGLIISLSRGPMGCIASNRWFADYLGVSISSVKRYLVDLKEFELIELEEIERKAPKANVRIIVPTSKIIKSKEEIKKSSVKQYQKKQKNILPNDIESDWLDDYIDSL